MTRPDILAAMGYAVWLAHEEGQVPAARERGPLKVKLDENLPQAGVLKLALN